MHPPDLLTLDTLAEAFADVGYVVLASDGAIVRAMGVPGHVVLRAAQAASGARIDHLPGETGSRWAKSLAHVRRTGTETAFEYSLPSNGRKQVYEARVAPLASHGYVAIVVDVTERKVAEAALRAGLKETKRMLEHIHAFVIECDRDGVVTDWSPSAERLFGLQLVDAVGRPLRCLPIRWNWPGIGQAMARSVTGLKPTTIPELKIVDVTERERFMELTVEPICSDEGIGLILRATDRTDHLRMQRELAQAQKLEAIGQLAAGIAHEINSPMQFISDNHRFIADALQGELWPIVEGAARLTKADQKDEEVGRCLDELRRQIAQVDLEFLLEEIPRALAQSLEGVTRVTGIVQAMKQFAHPDPEEKAPVDLHQVIESTITVCRHEWKYVADVRTEFDPAVPLVWAVRGALGQVFLNLIVNAAHAIGDAVSGQGGKGTITIRTKRDGDWVEIRVSDTGTGIAEEHREKIFDPFFTTKPVGKGTGQGLTIARSVIVGKHGGQIAFETEVGRGTTFIVRLPIDGRPSSAAPSVNGGGSTLLDQR